MKQGTKTAAAPATDAAAKADTIVTDTDTVTVELTFNRNLWNDFSTQLAERHKDCCKQTPNDVLNGYLYDAMMRALAIKMAMEGMSNGEALEAIVRTANRYGVKVTREELLELESAMMLNASPDMESAGNA